MSSPPHGLVYPPSLLPSLRILTPRPHPHQPIRLLPLHLFSQIHFSAQLSHCPDNIIFPFLHGLEGSNHAQNLFFATGSTRGGHGERVVIPPAKVPRFRGLIWCVCEDDLEPDLITVVSKLEAEAFEDVEELEDDFYSSEEDLDTDELERLENRSDEFAMDVDAAGFSEGGDKHMHPVHHRTPLSQVTPTPTPCPNSTKIQISTTAPHDRRDSNASTASSSVSSTSKFTEEDDRESVSTSATSLSPSSPSSPLSESQCPTSAPAQTQTPNPNTNSKDTPPLLTSTFRPKDLLRDGVNGPEFIPPRIPDGISLRNFGIQVVRISFSPNSFIHAYYYFILAGLCYTERYRCLLSQRPYPRSHEPRRALQSRHRESSFGTQRAYPKRPSQRQQRRIRRCAGLQRFRPRCEEGGYGSSDTAFDGEVAR